MSASPQHENTHEHLRLLAGNLDSGALSKIEAQLNELHPAEIANLLESLPLQNRRIVWELTNPELAGDILVEVNDEVRLGLIEHTDEDDLVAAVGSLDTDDLADIFEDLPKVVLHQVVRAMSNQDRRRLQSVMSYDEDSAGGLMNPDMVTIRPNVDLGVVLRYLRQRSELPANTDKLFVVDRDDRYLGILNISDLLTTNSKESVSNTMITDQKALLPTLSANEVALFFEDYNLVSAPVVDEDNRLLGRITVDDVVDVIRDEADRSLLSLAGLDEDDDMFAPVTRSAKRRAVWLGINLFTAFLAAWVIGIFAATIEQVVALAVLMPIVASMGGIAGSQTLMLVIRGIALNQIGTTNARWLLWKELAVGSLNGILWACVVAAITGFWFQSQSLGLLIGVALVINLIVAALAGATIPLTLKKMNIDPAIAGGVILTTVTDVIGFFSFLGLATVFLI
ncbi:MAG: magnesium transporter [Cycloclasticus pugetii]|jgi:magnesium transporter|uniref:Magnesium transporter MgtE n=1 Tax=Cycloclasticus pugetii TaxID=34068 RepID=A0AB33Z2P8_9GAMM|nr:MULTISPECIES: magnesium transporter [Cycloclasticus]AFT67683.1 Magnesium transporter [Cycloclasticus sp. P1]EPD13517.1 magnesium transporter [Cycloclasticus pugetii]MBV1897738.1 magnesium transporter [Cycloclasticus sp.]MDF1828770.1 magnesium transporter [Cycloclasticus pugetii]PHR47478.1 MAG: magnesium transporter [Cycloclasticus sp.]